MFMFVCEFCNVNIPGHGYALFAFYYFNFCAVLMIYVLFSTLKIRWDSFDFFFNMK